MEAIVAALNRTLPGWFGYFKHVKASELSGIDGWIRMRLRSILRKRRGLKGRGRGIDDQRWPNRYFKKLGLTLVLHASRNIRADPAEHAKTGFPFPPALSKLTPWHGEWTNK
jgi:hypothetical protein